MEASADNRESRIGKRVVPLPKGVNVAINGQSVKVEGPKGKLAFELPPQVSAKKDGEALKVESSAGGRNGRRLQGLGRALLMSILAEIGCDLDGTYVGALAAGLRAGRTQAEIARSLRTSEEWLCRRFKPQLIGLVRIRLMAERGLDRAA